MKIVTHTFRVAITAKPEAASAYVSDLTQQGEWTDDLKNEITVTDYQPPTRFAFVARQVVFTDCKYEFTVHPQDRWNCIRASPDDQQASPGSSPFLAADWSPSDEQMHGGAQDETGTPYRLSLAFTGRAFFKVY